MGYTHYWNRGSKATRLNDFNRLLPIFNRVCEPYRKVEGVVYDADKLMDAGTIVLDDLTIERGLIVLNGIPDHETFVIDFSDPDPWNFCKTARKPYDLVVAQCLLALVAGVDGFSFSSDGFNYDTEDGVTAPDLELFMELAIGGSDTDDTDEILFTRIGDEWKEACIAFDTGNYMDEIKHIRKVATP